MSNKRYYWLKLNETFFEDDTIEWIEEQENGERYLLFYLKLCLKSLKDEGCLIRYVGETLIPYDVKALSKLTNTDQDTVAVSLKVFEEIGLIERRDSGEIYMKQIDEMIGSETDVAKRVRKHRARQAALQSNIDETKCNTEIEIEKDIERDIDKDKDSSRNNNFKEIAQLYQQIIGQANSITADWIDGHLEEYGFEWLKNALLIAEEQGKRNKSYVNGILDNWKNEGGMKLGGKDNGANNRNDSSNSKESRTGQGEAGRANRAGITSF